MTHWIKYLRSTPNITISLSEDYNPVNKWWVDAAYAVHPYSRSQTGGILTLGEGEISSFSLKQNINTHSSTESELVVVDDMI